MRLFTPPSAQGATGLKSRRHKFFDRERWLMDMEIKPSGRTGREFALLLFDLDGLKQINDRYGHLTGSHALCRVADVLSFCRNIDTAARYGGDVFAVVLRETGAEAASQVAQRICESLAHDRMGPLLSVSIVRCRWALSSAFKSPIKGRSSRVEVCWLIRTRAPEWA